MQAPHVHGLLIERIVGEGRANADLDVFCRAFAHHHVVDFFQINADRITDFVASHPD